MSVERLAYLDRAFKTLGLSLGLPEADEISRVEGRLGLNGRSGKPDECQGAPLRTLTQPDRRLSGCDAQVLIALGQVAVTKVFGLPPITPATRVLAVPGLGPTAVRVVLNNASLETALRVESAGLERVSSYVLCEFDLNRLNEVALIGWVEQADILRAPKVRLSDGGPDVHVVGIPGMRRFSPTHRRSS